MTKRTCSIEGCERDHYARGWCNPHWQKWRKYDDPVGGAGRGPAICSIRNCEEAVAYRYRGWCKHHYMNWYRHGSAEWEAPASPFECAVPECGGKSVARGWCNAHYRRWQKYGDPLGAAPARQPRLCSVSGCGRRYRANGFCDAHAKQAKRAAQIQPVHPSGGGWKYQLDHSYFDEISDERRAYWLGFITADGCILQRDGRNALLVELKESDSSHLQLLCDDLQSDRPIRFGRGCARVAFNSKQLVEALGRLGVGPRKSKTVTPWAGAAHLMPHYWRGLFDGDGTLSPVRGKQKWCLALCGSEACVRGFGAWARSMSGSTASARLVTGSRTCWRWAVTGTAKAQSLCAAMYEGAGLSLARKQDLAEQLMLMRFNPPRT